MSWPAPTRKDHEAFCRAENWREVRNATGRTGDHFIFEIDLPDGQTLRTRVSHPIDRTGYGQSIWGHILRNQLKVTAEEFWACVQGGVLPARGAPAPPPARALPASMVYQLITKVGLDDATVAAMTKEEAAERLQRYYTEGS